MNTEQKNYMATASGRTINLSCPVLEDIHIGDIAHHLSYICRFNGAVRRFYSVLEHSILVHDILWYAGHNHVTLYEGLLHDAHEGYTADDITGKKRAIPAIKEWEKMWALKVKQVFLLPQSMSVDVKDADRMALSLERDFVCTPAMRDNAEVWTPFDVPENTLPRGILRNWQPGEGIPYFLARFHSLRQQLGMDSQ